MKPSERVLNYVNISGNDAGKVNARFNAIFLEILDEQAEQIKALQEQHPNLLKP